MKVISKRKPAKVRTLSEQGGGGSRGDGLMSEPPYLGEKVIAGTKIYFALNDSIHP